MKITAIETLRTAEFANVLWVRVHTDAGLVGLGETFYGAGGGRGASARHAGRAAAGPRPAADRGAAPRDAEPADGAVQHRRRYRAASAVDIALWDLFGKHCGQPVHQMLGGLCRDRQRIYNTCAGYGYVRSHNIKPVSTWNFDDERRAVRGPARLHDPGRRGGREPARSRHHGDEDLAVRPGRDRQ